MTTRDDDLRRRENQVGRREDQLEQDREKLRRNGEALRSDQRVMVPIQISREQYDEIQRRIAAGEAATLVVEATGVRTEKDMLLMQHIVLGDGVEGLADQVKGLKAWQASLQLGPQQIQDFEARKAQQAKDNRYRLAMIAAASLGGISTLVLLFQLLERWVHK